MPPSPLVRTLLGAGILSCTAPAARAQAPAADSGRVLPTLDVLAPRGLGGALAGVRTVTLTRADAERLGATSLADALEAQGGAFVRRYGPGGLASIALRGTSAGQTAVLLDGLRLSDPQLGQLDLSLLPVALLDRADVVHGAASAWHGADAMGGALLLTPRTGQGAEALLVGHPDGLDAGAAAGVERGAVSAHVAASGEWRSGRFGFLDRTRFPAATVPREGAGRRGGSLYASAHRAQARGATTASVWLAGAHRGLPGPAGTAPGGERQDDALARVWASHAALVRATALHMAAWWHAGTLRYRNPSLDLDETSRTRTIGVDAEARRALSRALRLGVGGTLSGATARHPSLAGHAAEGLAAGFAELRYHRGALAATGALRVDHYVRAASYTSVSPHTGMEMALGQGWTAKVAAGRSFRAPTLNDRFWQGAGRADLRPERGWSAEGGLHLARAWGVAEVTAFGHRVRDEIVWQPERGVWRPANVRRTRTRGLEASVRAEGARLEGGLFAAYTHAVDRSAPTAPTFERQLRYVPRVTARGDAALHVPLRRFALRLDAAVQAVGARPVTADESQTLPPYALVRVGGALTRGAFALGVHLDNLFAADYRIVEGYPMPGRQAEMSLRVRF